MKTQQLQKIRSGKKNFDGTDKKKPEKVAIYINYLYICPLKVFI